MFVNNLVGIIASASRVISGFGDQVRAGVKSKIFTLGRGQALLLQNVRLHKTEFYGPVNLALACESASGELWYIVSNEATTLQTFREYGLRFDIEESFLDDKSNGFELESSAIRNAPALSRLCLVKSGAAALASRDRDAFSHCSRN